MRACKNLIRAKKNRQEEQKERIIKEEIGYKAQLPKGDNKKNNGKKEKK